MCPGPSSFEFPFAFKTKKISDKMLTHLRFAWALALTSMVVNVVLGAPLTVIDGAEADALIESIMIELAQNSTDALEWIYIPPITDDYSDIENHYPEMQQDKKPQGYETKTNEWSDPKIQENGNPGGAQDCYGDSRSQVSIVLLLLGFLPTQSSSTINMFRERQLLHFSKTALYQTSLGL